jgi:nucleoside-diphosphate-sugar epimerase
MSAGILVTGAGGFVGQRLVAALRASGETVHALTRADGDLAHSTPSAVGIGCVYHLAARTFVPDSWRDPIPFCETNVLGTWNVLEFCRRAGARMVLVSSYVYGRPQSLPIAEDHPLQAFNPYSLTKILAERTAQFYRDSCGVALTIVRPFNLYGPGQSEAFLIPTLIRQALDPSQPCYDVADDRPRRDHLFIDDFVELLAACCSRPPGIYNAGSGVSSSIAELVDLLNALTGQTKPLRARGEHRPDDVLDVVADIRRAEAEIGWRPRISLREGLALTLKAARSAAGS